MRRAVPHAAAPPAEALAGDDASTVGEQPAGTRSRPGAVLVAAGLLLVCQLVVRAWLASERSLYTDDITYGTEALGMSLFSADYLVEDRAGHFMPAALLLHGALYRQFPLEWWPFAVALLVLQLLASLAVLRLLRVLMGDRPALLVPLAVYLFGTISLGSFSWWAAAMNSLPLQIGMAWVVADAVLLARTGRRRYAVTGTAAFLLTLLFYERAVLVPMLAFAVVLVLVHADGGGRPLRTALSRGRLLWAGLFVVLAAWVANFLFVLPSDSVGSSTVAQVTELARISATSFGPAVLGGPWTWFANAGTPLAAPPSWAAPAGAVVLLVLVAWSLRLRGAALLWLVAVGYFLAGAVLVGVGRGSLEFAGVLPLTYRYFAAEAVIAAIVIGLLFVLPARRAVHGAGLARPGGATAVLRDGPAARSRAAAVLVAVLTAGFIGSSLYSTVTYNRAWPAGAENYVPAARAALAGAGDEPLLDWNLSGAIVWSEAPWNRASQVFDPLEDRPPFAEYTSDLRQLDDTGALRPAEVVPGVFVVGSPDPGCGWAIGDATAVPLGGPMPSGGWTAQLNYVAARDGMISVALGTGEPVWAPVRAGVHPLYVTLTGEGPALVVTAATPDLGLCVGSGVVGLAAIP